MVFEKEKIKKTIEKWLKFLFNPRLLLCLGIAWFITNGWCYVFMALGELFHIDWLFGIGFAYFLFLWMPTPEKIVTVAIAIFLLKLLFPNDQKTLAVLRDMQKSIKGKIAEVKAKRAEKKASKKIEKEEKKRQKSTNP